MAVQEPISLRDFQRRFVSEEACAAHLLKLRWPNGFSCPRCRHERAYRIQRRRGLYQCAGCRYQVSLTAGTVFHKTRLPLQVWFWAIFLVAHDKRGVSARMLARELEIGYPAAWLMLHKIRKAMGDRDAAYALAGIVELDDAYFGAPTQGGKRGRGTEKASVLIGVSLSDEGRPRYAKMRLIADLKAETLQQAMTSFLAPGAHLATDGHRSYPVAANAALYPITAKNFDPAKDASHLKWLHTIISNAKAFIAGTYHGLDKKHLQAYLDEYCYRFSRRNFSGQGFNRLLKAAIATTTVTYADLTA
jgi:transposase-like protein